MKKMKVVAIVSAAAVTAGVLCGCAPLGRLGQIVGSAAREARAEVREQIEQDGRERFPEEYYNMTSAYGSAEAAVDDFAEYAPFGLTFEEANGQNWFGDKPLAGLYDAGYNTVTIGTYADIGAFVVVNREAGNIVGIYETDKETFSRLSGIDGIGSPKKAAEENGLSFYREDKTIKGLDQAAFAKLENELRMKYKNEKAFVECNDYVFSFYKGDLLRISSACATDLSEYVITVYFDYCSAEKIDLNIFERDKTDQIVMQAMNESNGSKTELDTAVKKAVAQAYGISADDLLIRNVLGEDDPLISKDNIG